MSCELVSNVSSNGDDYIVLTDSALETDMSEIFKREENTNPLDNLEIENQSTTDDDFKNNYDFTSDISVSDTSIFGNKFKIFDTSLQISADEIEKIESEEKVVQDPNTENDNAFEKNENQIIDDNFVSSSISTTTCQLKEMSPTIDRLEYDGDEKRSSEAVLTVDSKEAFPLFVKEDKNVNVTINTASTSQGKKKKRKSKFVRRSSAMNLNNSENKDCVNIKATIKKLNVSSVSNSKDFQNISKENKNCNGIQRALTLDNNNASISNLYSTSKLGTQTSRGQKRSAPSALDDIDKQLNKKSRNDYGGQKLIQDNTEARDNRNKKWQLYKNMSPADCYDTVVNQWHFVKHPNPHENLTVRYNSPNIRIPNTIEFPRKPNSDIFQCTYVYNKILRDINSEINFRKNNLNRHGSRMSRSKFHEIENKIKELNFDLKKIQNGCEETYRFYYNILDNHGSNTSSFYIDEYRKTESMYTLDTLQKYKEFYSGN